MRKKQSIFFPGIQHGKIILELSKDGQVFHGFVYDYQTYYIHYKEADKPAYVEHGNVVIRMNR